MDTTIMAGRVGTGRRHTGGLSGSTTHGTRRKAVTLRGAGTGVCLFVAVFIAIVAAGALPSLADRTAPPSTTHVVTVEPADTLWSIARANPVAGVSTARLVEAIRRANDLPSGAALQPGDTLRVPSAEAADGVEAFAMR